MVTVSYRRASRNVKTGKVKAIRFSMLEAICRELNFQPGEILEYQRAPAVEEVVGESSG
jgi:DNA-binding Xre family transcriptional regulator